MTKELIRILHKLEHVSSDEHVGTVAENLMEALRQHERVAAEVRQFIDVLHYYILHFVFISSFFPQIASV